MLNISVPRAAGPDRMRRCQQLLTESRDAGHILLYFHDIQPGLDPGSLKSSPDIRLLTDTFEQPTLTINGQSGCFEYVRDMFLARHPHISSSFSRAFPNLRSTAQTL
jgi:hypothetical protein